MPDIQVDPEREEIDLLLASCTRLPGGRVLEVGCGSGRLTRLYARAAGAVLAIDRDPGRIAQALAAGQAPAGRVVFRQASILDDPPARDGPFDVVILSWSL
ncbi:MAG: Methyltransferase domain [Acidobacteria bacterium]|nr:Methyltransferase domain [Acidobacteriota bacterium]